MQSNKLILPHLTAKHIIIKMIFLHFLVIQNPHNYTGIIIKIIIIIKIGRTSIFVVDSCSKMLKK